jgi:hypothetical protein
MFRHPHTVALYLGFQCIFLEVNSPDEYTLNAGNIP